MPSFDIVSEVDIQEVRNGVENATREVESRFDFRGVEATFELNDANKTIKVLSESDFQVNQLLDILRAKLLKRGIEGTSLDVPEDIVHSGKTWFVEAKLKQGIESAVQKKIEFDSLDSRMHRLLFRLASRSMDSSDSLAPRCDSSSPTWSASSPQASLSSSSMRWPSPD